MVKTFAEILEDRKLGIKECSRITGVSGQLIGYLINGYKTLPCLALQIGMALNLSREEVQMLGQPLDPHYWTLKKTAGDRSAENMLVAEESVDLDPQWYNQLRNKKYMPKPSKQKGKR